MSDNLKKRIENLEYKELKEVSSLINAAELEGIDKLRVVAVKKDKMVDNFATAVEAIAEKHGEEAIPEKALLLFNDLFGEGGTRLDNADDKMSDAAEDASEDASDEPVESEPVADDKPADDEPEAETEKKDANAEAKASKKKSAKKAAPKKDAVKDKKTGPKKTAKKAPSSSSTKKGGKKKKSPPAHQTDKYGTRPYTLARAFVESLQDKPKTMKQIQKEDWNPQGFVFPETLNRLVEANLAEVNDKGVISIVG